MKKAKLFMMLALLVMGVSNLFAQNVTVRPDNGSTLPAAKQGGASDTFYDWGGFATWKHEQLALTMTTGDSDNNTGTDANGQLTNPANDIFKTTNTGANATNYLQIGAGKGMDTYIIYALPKGYRFTGYTITFKRINRVSGMPNSDTNVNSTNSISFGETNNAFSFTNVRGTYEKNIAHSSRGNYSPKTISRTSNTVSDMGNILYFKLENGERGRRAYIQLDHVELYFTAENNYAPLLPTPNVSGQSAVDIPFTTNKMDYGILSKMDKEGNPDPNGRISYFGALHDLNANLILYESGSVKTVTTNNFDGTAGDMVDYKDGSISSEGNYFKLDASKHGHLTETGDTAIYFIESPIWATNSSAANSHKEPIGYRIVGASFDLKGEGDYTPATFRIQHVGSDGYTYGLNSYEQTRIRYSQTLSYQTIWSIDKDGYIYYGTGESKTYLTLYNYTDYWTGNTEINFQVTSTKPSANQGTFEIVENENNGTKQIRLKNSNYYIGYYEYVDFWGNTQSRAYLTTGNDRAFYTEISAEVEATLSPYTFVIYDKTGTKVEKKAVINGNDGTLSIDGLNNDAVKIGVIGTGYISGRLTMQALDPYIDHLDIVCHEDGGNGGTMTQQFNATDFSVRGGKFTFYVPNDFKGDAKFTFENLYSLYGDDTYYNETNSKNHSRYYFVGSTYSGYENNDVYARYKNKTHRNADYTKKITCLKPGNVSYTFNNAATVTTGDGGTYQEYPFTLALYQNAGGNFNTDFIYSSDDMGATPEVVKTAYLFTSDETRYNIAPTTATQHVYYAYYRMDINMERKDYRPIFTWDPIYDETFYAADNSNIKRDPQWGLKITTEQVTDDQGTHSGYLTVSKILDVIKNGLEATAAQGTPGQTGYVPAQPAVQGLDATGEKAPKNMNQILYIDASDLMSIVENQTPTTSGSTTTYTSHPLSELKSKLATNALIYLPYGSKSNNDNFAYNTIAQYTVKDENNNITKVTPNFRGASNVVIADRYPFFAPYDIQVDAAKMAVYERTITNPSYDPILHATIVLPFEINVETTEDGKHTGLHINNDGQGTPFTLSTMNPENALAKAKDSKTDFYGEGYFTEISEKSVPNTPYIVTLENQGEDGFKAHVNGSLVKATPKAANGVFTNETSTGTFEGTTYNFTHTGTYTGKEIANAATATETVFYFANNHFVDSKTLSTGKGVKVLPFRSFYAYTTSGGSAGAKMTSFRIVFGENDEMSGTNGINDLRRDADLAVIPGDGCITLMAKTDKDVTIHAVNGQTIDKCNLRAGDSRTVAVPAGVYIINGVKMIVK